MFEPRFVRTLAQSALILTCAVGVAACPPGPKGDWITSPTGFGVGSISPSRGATFETTQVGIAGSGFAAGARVAVDGVDVPASVTSASAITATLPAHAPGRVEIVVTNGGGETAPVPNGFTYVAPSPITIAGLEPDSVLVTGEQIVINGSGFLTGVVVTIDRVPVAAAPVGSSRLAVIAPAHAAGVVDVAVTNPFTEPVVLSGALTYKPLPPMQIDRVEPGVGSTAGGTLLAIFGPSFQSFQPGATVRIDGQLVAAEIGDFFALYIDTPAHAPGPVDIVVTNPDGQTGRLVAGFTYAPPQAFSFTGRWYAFLRPSWSGGPGFQVEDDKVTRLWCGFETVNLIPTPLPVVKDGAFSFNALGQITGHVVADGEAAGTVSIPGCGSGKWYAYRR